MTVKELKDILTHYNDDAEVIVVDWGAGRSFSPSIGCDDEDEYSDYCRIGID